MVETINDGGMPVLPLGKSDNFLVIDYAVWSGGVVGGIFRTPEGNVLIRISEKFRNDDAASSAISVELVARFHRHLEENPMSNLWPIHVLLGKVPEVDTQAQEEGLGKLSIFHLLPVRKMLDFKLIG